MRIAVNLLPFRTRLAGTGRYTRNILGEMLRQDHSNEYVFFVSSQAAAHFEYLELNVTQVPVRLPESSAFRIAYEQLALPFRLRARKVDLLFTPSVAIPIAWTGNRVTVIHDMIAEHRGIPKYPPARSGYVRWMSRYAARHSRALITVSEYSRREIAHYAGVPIAKIALAPNAVDLCLRPVTEPELLARARERYRLPERFILYLGTLEPGKNLVRLIQAYARLKNKHPGLEQHLILAGAAGWGYKEIEAEAQRNTAGGIKLIGYVDEDDLAALYSLADLFVYPSFYEGFGLPVLEAMACGTPVIASNVSAVPEVVQDARTGKAAGLLVSPTDTDQIAEAMAMVLTDKELSGNLKAAGLERAAMFRWDTPARAVLDRIAAIESDEPSE